jgi:hypothetical protein
MVDKIDFAIAFSKENFDHRTYFYLPSAQMVSSKDLNLPIKNLLIKEYRQPPIIQLAGHSIN